MLRSFSLLFFLSACVSQNVSATDAALHAVAEIHGAAGPWAVAGYRMGEFALAKLGAKRGGFDLDVTHHAPAKVQYSCMVDGNAAATGASLGKLSLHLVPAAEDELSTTYVLKSTGASLTLQPTAEFKARYKDVPHEKFDAVAREILALPYSAIFAER